MLSIITDPTNYQLSKNPVVLQLETDSYVSAEGSLAVFVMEHGTGSGANAVGGTLTLIWELDSVVMTVATTPDDSGYQVRPKAALSDAAFAAQLLVDLKKNYKLSQTFIMSISSSTKIAFFSKVSGTQYALHANFSSLNFGYVDSGTYDNGSDTTYNQNYKMRADLYMESGFRENDFSKISTQELDPLENKCIFYFQEEINANLKFNLPDYNSTDPLSCTTVLKRFYIQYIEKYGSPVLPRQLNQTDTGYILKAGIPTQQAIGQTDLIESLYRTTAGTFLTRQPRTKKIRSGQKEYLSWCSNYGHDVKLGINIISKDGTTQVVYMSVITVTAYEVIMFPTGFTQLSLSDYIDFEDLKYYQVFVKKDGYAPMPLVITELFTYTPESDFFIDEHYFFFSNSDGGFDTIRMNGNQEIGFEHEKEVIKKTTLFDTPVVDGQFAEVNAKRKQVFKISTGFLKQEELNWVEDLFIAEKKFIAANDMFVPITIKTISQKQKDSQSNLFFYELEYEYAFSNSVVNLASDKTNAKSNIHI